MERPSKSFGKTMSPQFSDPGAAVVIMKPLQILGTMQGHIIEKQYIQADELMLDECS